MKFRMRDLLVAIILLSLTVSLAMPLIQQMREAEAQRRTTDNLKQLCFALHSCNDVNRRLPPAMDAFFKIRQPVTVHVHLLPFVGHVELHEDFVLQSPRHHAIVAPFVAPVDTSLVRSEGVQNYAANLRVFSDVGYSTAWDADMPAPSEVMHGTSAIPRTFVDGTANTAVFITKLATCGDGGSRYAASPVSPFAAFFGQNVARAKAHATDPQATFQLAPSQKQCLTRPLMGQSFKAGGIQIGLGDGSVTAVSPSVDLKTWNRLLHPNDGLPWDSDW